MPILLRLRELRRDPAAEAGGLLRLLLVWQRPVSAGAAPRRLLPDVDRTRAAVATAIPSSEIALTARPRRFAYPCRAFLPPPFIGASEEDPVARTTVAFVMSAMGALLTGCVAPAAGTDGTTCRGQAWTETRLFLGRGLPGGEVSEAQWREFVEAEVTPRLRDGFTVLDAAGFWRDSATGRAAMEASKVLVVLHPRTSDFDEAAEAISNLYMSRFAQMVVLRADHPVCAILHSVFKTPTRSP
jgi:hypothetical protein